MSDTVINNSFSTIMAANIVALVDEQSTGSVSATGADDRLVQAKLEQILTLLQSSNTNNNQTVGRISEAPSDNTQTTNTAVSTVSTNQYVARVKPTENLSNLAGMNPNTGKLVRGREYIQQRISDALHTPKASQVLLRGRGSDIMNLIDQPQNRLGVMKTIAAIVAALNHRLAGLPDFIISRVNILSSRSERTNGQLGIELSGQWLGNDIEVVV